MSRAGRWRSPANIEDALALLNAADQNDAMVLTMIGYSKRKSGALHEGIGYYHRRSPSIPTTSIPGNTWARVMW